MTLFHKSTLLVTTSILAIAWQAQAMAQTAAPAADVDAVVVTGSRLQNTGFTAPTPVTVLGVEQLQQRAPVAVADALYTLPQFVNNGPTQNNFGSSTVGTNQLNLRGLGATRTLVLVDGRRYVPQSTTTVFDTNLIPTGLVERTEVVTGGASAQYGSDAVAGVVNLILKDRLTGIHGTVQYGQTQYNDNKTFSGNLSGGFGFAQDRGHVILGAEYSQSDGAGVDSEGYYARPWGRKEYGLVALQTRAAGLPANILTSNVEYANMTAGGIIVSGPLRGTAFGVNAAPFAYTYGPIAGNQAMTGSLANYGAGVNGRQPLAPKLERKAFLARVSYDVTNDIKAFVEANYATNEGHGNTAQPLYGPGGTSATGGVIIAGPLFSAAGFPAGSLTNPYIPASIQAQMVARNLPTIAIGRLIEENGGFSTNNTSDTKQVTVGLNGTVFKDWRWSAYYQYGTNDYTLDVPNVMVPANVLAAAFPALVNGQLVCGTAALNAVNPNLNALQRTQVQPGCVPLNLFGIGSVTAANLAYIRNHMFYYIDAEQQTAAVDIAGSPFSTWAGPVSFAAGLERRSNSASATSDALGLINANQYGNYQPFSKKTIDITEGYVEFGVPLAKDMTLLNALDLNGAVRRTNYSTSGSVTSWKVGLTYEPTDFLRLRTTRSRDIRAPNIGELYASTGGVSTSSNPFANNQQNTIPNQTVGNPNLTPEIGDTWTAGITLQPKWSFFDGMRLSVDYYNIKIRDVIAALPLIQLQTQCFGPAAARQSSTYCEQYFVGYDPSVSVVGGPNFGRSPGYTGLRNSSANLNNLRTSGYDIEFAYRPQINAVGIPGRLNVRALASYVIDLDTVAATFNTLGQISGSASQGDTAGGTVPDWKWNVSFDYAWEKLSTLVQLRGATGVKNNVTLIGPDDPRYAAALSNPADPLYSRTINKNKLPASFYVDVGARYDLKDEGGKRIQLFANINNLLGKDPPSGWTQNLNVYDTLGRDYRIGVRFDY